VKTTIPYHLKLLADPTFVAGESTLARLEQNPQVEPERLDAVRRFLESDDGGEFYMFNVISTFREPVEMPGTGEKKPAPLH